MTFSAMSNHMLRLNICNNDIVHAYSDQEEAGDNEGKIAEENNEEPRAPQRKRKKVEDPLFSCPMCDRKFVESEINQHAFTCNAEPLYESRSRTNGYG